MFAFNIIVGVLLLISLALTSWWGYRVRQEQKVNTMVASELRQLHSKLAEVAKSASFVNQAKKNLVPDPRSGPSVEMLESPELLATIVTVLINKYGNTRLGLDDFAIGDDKFVSVYVDTNTDEILLSLDGGLADDSYEDALIGFANGTPDDNTYH